MLKELFPRARFSPPAKEASLSAAEEALGLRLPAVLRRLYLECDGFREDKGNAKYLLSLLDDDVIGSVVRITRHFRDQSRPDLMRFVFFGASSGDEWWAIHVERPTEIIVYAPGMGDEYEVAGTDLVEVWKEDYALYEEVE